MNYYTVPDGYIIVAAIVLAAFILFCEWWTRR